MIPTVLRHKRGCPQTAPVWHAMPQPEGVGVEVYECSGCGAQATSKRSAA